MNYYITCMICILAATIFVNTLETAAKTTNMDNFKSWDERQFNKHKEKSDFRSIPFSRQTRLYSRASKQHLQIINRTVNGLGIEESEFAKLKVVSDTFGRVKIIGAKTNRYLCMNKKGRLVGRKPKTGAKEKRKKCIFKERETSTGYRVYESVKHPKWFIAINKKGRVVPGPSSKKRRVNRQFLPRPHLTTTRPRKRNYRGRAHGFSRRNRMKRLKQKQRTALGKRKP